MQNLTLNGIGTGIVTPVITGGTVSAIYGTAMTNYQIVATGTPTSYALATGTLPAGLSLNTITGIISGTPTVSGNSSITVTATNTNGTGSPATLNFEISKKSLTVTGLTANNKTYDASNVVTLNSTLMTLNGVLADDTGNVSLDGTPTGTFTNANAGVAKAVTVTGLSISGTKATNYTLTQPTGITADISQKTISATGVTAANKVYNGTTVATVSGGTLSGVIAADTANVSISTTGTFASANVGTGIAVTVSLTGSAASNYLLTQPAVTADITIASQTITFNAIPTLNLGGATVNLNTYASASSGLAIAYVSSNPAVVSVSGNTLTIVGVGTATITASQVGDGNYLASTDATQNVTVSLVPSVIAQFDFSTFLLASAVIVTTKNSNVSVSDFAISAGNITAGSTSGNDFPNEPMVEGQGGGWTSTTQAGAKNFNFTVTANPGYEIEVTSMQFNALATAAGPSAFSFDIATGAASYTTNAPSTALVSVNQAVAGLMNLTSVPVLIQGWLNGSRTSSGGGIFRIDDVILKGYVTCKEPTAFTISGDAICAANVGLSNSELGVNYQLKVNGTDIGSPVAGTGSALSFGNQTTLGTYTIVATNSYCSASTTMTGSATIVAGSCVTIWDGTSWSNNAPNTSLNAIIDGNYDIPTNITANNLTVNSGKILTIKPTNTLTVAANLTNNGSIVFESTAAGTGSFAAYTGTAINGPVTVQRYITGRRAFRFLTPSVTTTSSIRVNWQNGGASTANIGTHITGLGGATNGFDPTGTNNPSLHTYDAQALGTSTTGFTAVTSTTATTLKAGVGYRVLVRGDRNVVLTNPSADNMNVPTTLSTTGTLTTGTVTFDSSASSPAPVNNNATNTQTNGYTLIGNPYVSPVDWNAVTKTGVNNNAYYTWDPTLGTMAQRGRYVVYTYTDVNTDGVSNVYQPSAGTLISTNRRYLQTGQAVFIKNADLAVPATVTFNEANKATTNSYVFRSNEQAMNTTGNASLFLTLYDPNELAIGAAPIDGALALFGADYSTALDANDVDKLGASGENVAFVRENKNLAIETVAPVAANDELFVKTIQFQANKNYTFKVNTINFDTTVNAKMVDLYLNTETPIDLTQPSFVSFATTTDANSYGSDRFKIVFSNVALTNENFNQNSVAIYPNPIVNNQFTISLPSQLAGNVTVTMSNVLGQEIYKSTTEAAALINVQPKQALDEGVYIVSISNNGQVIQSKVIVRN